jgi:hypothetical protein
MTGNFINKRLIWPIWTTASLTVCLLFVLYTQNVWEDFFITFKFSKNLADGFGLTYDGETKLHGFTSFFNTLIPAFIHWITDATSHKPALFFYRCISFIVFTSLTGILLQHLAKESRSMMLAALLFGTLILTDIKIISFAYNGQEAGFMIGFLALAVWAGYQGLDRSWRTAGLAWAGLMYTRPDSPVYITILAICSLFFGKLEIKPSVQSILKAAAVCAAIYLPWFLFVWAYFGTPVPNTITAKSMVNFPQITGLFGLATAYLHHLGNGYSWVFCPTYVNLGEWYPLLEYLSRILAGAASILWPFKRFHRYTRFASLATLGCGLYIGLIGLLSYPYPWYFPPFSFFALLTISTALLSAEKQEIGTGGRLLAPLVIAFSLFTFASGLYQLKWQQHYIENTVRTTVALWLKEHVRDDENVYLECLGYIGFFSERSMLDFPGMASPAVVTAANENDHNFYRTLIALKPDWVVLRPEEYYTATTYPEFVENYEIQHMVSESEAIDSHRPPWIISYKDKIPGIGYILFDSTFVILKRHTINS